MAVRLRSLILSQDCGILGLQSVQPFPRPIPHTGDINRGGITRPRAPYFAQSLQEPCLFRLTDIALQPELRWITQPIHVVYNPWYCTYLLITALKDTFRRGYLLYILYSPSLMNINEKWKTSEKRSIWESALTILFGKDRWIVYLGFNILINCHGRDWFVICSPADLFIVIC